MTTLFNTLFSFNFTHDFYPERRSDDFRLTPTDDCRKLMNNHDLFYKKKGIKHAIVYQKNEKTGAINRKIVSPVKLRFLVHFKNESLRQKTDFSTSSIGGHPQLPGRSMFYFNNLDAGGTVYNEDISSSGEMSISQEGEVSWTDLVAAVPAIFPIQVNSTMASNYALRKLKAGEGFEAVVADSIPAQQSIVKVDLSKQTDDLYKLSIDSITQPIYRSDDIFRAAPFGLIEIFLPANTDYAQEVKYFIEFRAL